MSPRIMTHLFADGGRIVKSTRTDYSEHLERDDMAVVVKNMMKEQHKAMFVALRSGELDELIGFSEEDPPGSVAGTGAVLERAASLIDSAQSQAQPSVKIEPPASQDAVPPSSEKEKPTSVQPVQEPAKPYAVSRPASIFSVPPPSSASIFGEVGIDEKSLDDAILSYLAEDESSEKKE